MCFVARHRVKAYCMDTVENTFVNQWIILLSPDALTFRLHYYLKYNFL